MRSDIMDFIDLSLSLSLSLSQPIPIGQPSRQFLKTVSRVHSEQINISLYWSTDIDESICKNTAENVAYQFVHTYQPVLPYNSTDTA